MCENHKGGIIQDEALYQRGDCLCYFGNGRRGVLSGVYKKFQLHRKDNPFFCAHTLSCFRHGILFAAFAAAKNNLLPANNRKPLLVYQVGLNLTCCMLLVRGVVQVLGMVPSAAMQGSLSGIAGIGHCLLGVGLVWILVGIRSSIAAAESTNKTDHQTV